ncbi:MAG TPA: hypothetical protein VNU45_03330, partial [Rummeliibacillus sp.]|nr:hypothetical protein [Rummeliibacillus sp.]
DLLNDYSSLQFLLAISRLVLFFNISHFSCWSLGDFAKKINLKNSLLKIFWSNQTARLAQAND